MRERETGRLHCASYTQAPYLCRYEEREMPILKAEFPTLRRSQLNEMIFRQWKKSPENPLVAAEADKRKREAEGRS